MIALQPMAADWPLVLHYLPGRTRRLVVAFAGVGKHEDRQPAPEFVGSAHDRGENHVLFVADDSRSWLNWPGLAEAIVAAVRDLAARIGAERVLALGNSMGGSMALMLGPLLRPDLILAIVPQFSADPARVPEETRWAAFRQRIAQWPFPAVPDLAGRGLAAVILHGTRGLEGIHWRRFPHGNSDVLHFLFPNAGHALARVLNEQGRLRPLVRAAARGNRLKIRHIIREAGGVSRGIHETRHPAPAKEA